MADLWLVSESKWKREDGPSSPRPGGRNDVFFSTIELQHCSHELRRTLLVDSGLVTDEKPVPVYGRVASSCHQLSPTVCRRTRSERSETTNMVWGSSNGVWGMQENSFKKHKCVVTRDMQFINKAQAWVSKRTVDHWDTYPRQTKSQSRM